MYLYTVAAAERGLLCTVCIASKIPQIFDDPFLLVTRECTMSNLRIGNGYDIHKLVAGRPLILGGVEIPHSHGLFGNTDADVLVHAIIDAILGALSLGDIGHHFPPDDPSVKDARSLDMLRQVVKMIAERSWRINNVDSIVVAECPKLQPHVSNMCENIAAAMGVANDHVSVKAKTNEKVGAGQWGEKRPSLLMLLYCSCPLIDKLLTIKVHAQPFCTIISLHVRMLKSRYIISYTQVY